jgi:dihydrofolate reductase
MGATTYRVMSGYADAGGPGTEAMAGLSKVVFSTTLSEPPSWANTQLVTDDPVDAVREMKDKGTRSMRTMGSLTLCRSLLESGLVDRFRVVVFPVITGSSGRDRIYDGYPDVALEMISSRTFDGRIQLLAYVPTILTGPPDPTKPTADPPRADPSTRWQVSRTVVVRWERSQPAGRHGRSTARGAGAVPAPSRRAVARRPLFVSQPDGGTRAGWPRCAVAPSRAD